MARRLLTDVSMKLPTWMVSVGVVVGLCSVLWADPQGDLDSAKRDYDAAKSKLDEVRSSVNRYIEQSRALRTFDSEKLNSLIEQLCRQDTEPNDREVDAVVQGLVDTSVDSVRRNYDDTSRAGSDRIGEIERLLDQTKSVRNRANDLKSQDAVKDEASRLRDEAQKLVDEADRLMEKTQADFRSLDNVKNGTMNGANNPRIRAKMDYGKEMHVRLQGQYYCDEKEVVLNAGRPDCVLFIQDDCRVMEFKPDSGSSDAQAQARRYVEDVAKKYKDDERARKCKKDSSGFPIFRAVGNTYQACRP